MSLPRRDAVRIVGTRSFLRDEQLSVAQWPLTITVAVLLAFLGLYALSKHVGNLP